MSLILILSPLTQASTGNVVGTASINLDAATVSASGVGTALGSAAITLDAATVSATGVGTVLGTASITTGSATVSSAGVIQSVATGTAAITLGSATVSSGGLSGPYGTLSKALDAATVSSAGVGTALGSLSATTGGASVSAAGEITPVAVGTLSTTLGAASVASSGWLVEVGTLSIPLDAATVAAAGAVDLATVRERVLALLLEKLSTVPGVSGRVYRSRQAPLSREEMPAIIVEPISDDAVVSNSWLLDWTLSVRISVVVRSDVPDQTADTLVESIHSKIMLDPGLGGLSMDVQPQSTSWELLDADLPAGVISCDYAVLYRTSLTDLTVV